jgi:hypothetical protein
VYKGWGVHFLGQPCQFGFDLQKAAVCVMYVGMMRRCAAKSARRPRSSSVAARQISPIKEPLARSLHKIFPRKFLHEESTAAPPRLFRSVICECVVCLRRKSFQSPRNNHSYVPVGFIGITGERFSEEK